MYVVIQVDKHHFDPDPYARGPFETLDEAKNFASWHQKVLGAAAATTMVPVRVYLTTHRPEKDEIPAEHLLPAPEKTQHGPAI